MKRVVIRFGDGSTTSFDLWEDPLERDLFHRLGFFPGKRVARVKCGVTIRACPGGSGTGGRRTSRPFVLATRRGKAVEDVGRDLLPPLEWGVRT